MIKSAPVSFKQFLEEIEPLETLSLEMWFRHNVDNNKDRARNFVAWWRVELDDLPDETLALLIAKYSGEIPYDVAKGDSDIMPDQWLHARITRELRATGIIE